MTAGRRKRLVIAAAIALGPPLALLAMAGAIYRHVRIDVPPRLSAPARAVAIDAVRRSLETGRAVAAEHPELARPLPERGPVVVTIWDRGQQLGRMTGYGATIAEALDQASAEIAERAGRIAPEVRKRSRIKVDVVVGRGPLVTGLGAVSALALHPGLEGLGVTVDGTEILLPPDDLIARRLLFRLRPLSFVPEVRLGLDLDRANINLAVISRIPVGEFNRSDRHYWRFRTDSFVEGADGTALPLTRGVVPGPREATPEVLREAALAGGRYLVAHLAPTGRYVYEVDLHSGRQTDPSRPRPYSLPRHAGTTYFLAELYRHTHEEFLREPIERAFRHLHELVERGGCTGTLPSGRRFVCVVDTGEKVAHLGSTALAVVALVEFRRATGATTYDKLATEMTEWLLSMQRPDGSFAHTYDVARGARDEHTQLMYYSGESALALARMYEVHRDPRYLDAAERALDWLIGWYDQAFAVQFFYGEEHWTCIAAEAAWPALRHDRYRRFCDGYGEFLRAQQPVPGELPDQADLAGGYGFTPVVVPANTPSGSRTEAMISAYQLGVHHGKPSPELERQIMLAMKLELSQQVRADSLWNIPARDAIGAVPATPVDHMVRIDYVQHVCSAMLRASELPRARLNR